MTKPTTPRGASAVILLRSGDLGPSHPLVYWVRRHARMAFQGNFQAFPGGQREGDETARETAARELFEETGVLVARGAERVAIADLRDLRRRLVEEKAPFAQLLAERDLELDDALLSPAGRWVTPAFSPRRFDTWFFTAWLPEGQEVELWEGELDHGDWLAPEEAVAQWERGSLLVAPPILHAMRT